MTVMPSEPIIHVGSTNPTKIEAVMETIALYDGLKHGTVTGFPCKSLVSEQPMSMHETTRGAVNRALAALAIDGGADYGIGIESGLMRVPCTITGYMDFCAVVVAHSKKSQYFLGLSPAFECPQTVIDLVLQNGIDLDEAFFRAGLTESKKLGRSGGAVGLLTGGRITRKEYTKQALIMALIGLNHGSR